MGFSAVVLERNPKLAQSLAGGLSSHFNSVHLTRSRDELRERVAKHRPELVILGLEYSRLPDVGNLHPDFPRLPFPYPHPLPHPPTCIPPLQPSSTTSR